MVASHGQPDSCRVLRQKTLYCTLSRGGLQVFLDSNAHQLQPACPIVKDDGSCSPVTSKGPWVPHPSYKVIYSKLSLWCLELVCTIAPSTLTVNNLEIIPWIDLRPSFIKHYFQSVTVSCSMRSTHFHSACRMLLNFVYHSFPCFISFHFQIKISLGMKSRYHYECFQLYTYISP